VSSILSYASFYEEKKGGEPMPGKLQGPHNEFGQVLAAFCILYGGISISELARRAGIPENTLLDNMAEGKTGPSTATLDKLWIALDELSQNAPLRSSFPLSKPPLYNLADRSTPEQKTEARGQLDVLKHFADVQAENQRLKKENEQLRSRRRPRTS
jgi:hypothetical protein